MSINKIFGRKSPNMAKIDGLSNNKFEKDFGSKKPKSRKKFWIILGVIVVLVLGAFLFFSSKFRKISGSGLGLGNTLVNLVVPEKYEKKLQGEEEGRINIALLGMRGEGVVGGGTLADTIMIASIKIIKDPNNKDAEPTYKTSLISIPRDLYVIIPETNTSSKINGVYAYGEQKEHGGGGIKLMKQILEDVSGQKIHYAMAINFNGFKQIVDALGGVEVTLEKEFSEFDQFHQEHVCDGDKGGVFNKPTGKFEYKYVTRKDGTKYVGKAYPICANGGTEECGGVFKIPAGTSVLKGDQALCYARARYNSSDFDRARRQQEILKQLKKKVFMAGFDFNKLNEMSNVVGNNLALQMGELWEMERFFALYKKMGDPEIKQKVLENSDEGLLYSHEGDERGYILIPRGDNYDKIREMFVKIVE